MKFDKQQILIVGAGILLIGGFTVLRYIPIVRQKYTIAKTMDAQESVIEKVRSHSAMIPELKQQKAQLVETLASFDERVPQGRNFAQLWQQIADVMNECNLSDQLVQPGQEVTSEQLGSIPLMIECSGSLAQIYTFFQSLERFDRLVRIEEVKLKNDAEYGGLLKLNAKANVYYQPDETDNG